MANNVDPGSEPQEIEVRPEMHIKYTKWTILSVEPKVKHRLQIAIQDSRLRVFIHVFQTELQAPVV